jgi:spore coat polysaccharide biosynthesis protein SpsF
MKNTGIVIQARMGSTRLPGKVLMEFCGIPMILFQVGLLRKYNFGFDIVIATSTEEKDLEIVQLCKENKLNYMTGSEKDVFNRYRKVIQEYRFDNIIRLTADNPLVSYSIIDAAIKSHSKYDPDITSTRRLETDNNITRYVPKGFSVDIIRSKALLAVAEHNLDDYQREHVIPVFFNGQFKVNICKPRIDYLNDMSIDTYEEYLRIKRYAKRLLDDDKLLRYLGYE